jgi:uncharacterized protein
LKDQAIARSLQDWDDIFKAKAEKLYPASDPSHDALHINRVVTIASALAREEGADMHIVLPAAYFHDFVNVPKNDPRRAQASRLSAEAAAEYLASVDYPAAYMDAIRHAIAAHSFSANIKPETLEAEIVQDADRLDSLGAIGIGRCFSTSALMQRPYYCANDIWADHRELDDKKFTLDHFEIKLLKLGETMRTKAARTEAEKRIKFMREFLAQLKEELQKEPF